MCETKWKLYVLVFDHANLSGAVFWAGQGASHCILHFNQEYKVHSEGSKNIAASGGY